MVQANAGAGDAPAKLFRGYDSIANGMLNENAVAGGSDSNGGRSLVNIQVCESLSELAQALDIDGSLSVSYLKALNVTAKMSFAQSLKVTSRSISIVVYASHESGTWTAKGVRLADGIKAPANDEEAADFVDSYGDSYVSAATEGGEYYAVYTFHTETQAEQKDLTASLKAEGIYAGVSAELSLQSKLSNFLARTTTNWTFKQQITGHANPKLPTQDKLIEYAIDFPSKPLDAPVTTGFKVSGYEGVPGIGRRKFARIVENRDHFLGDDGLLRDFARLSGIQNQIFWLKGIYDRYAYKGDSALLALERQVKEDLGKIGKQITTYKRDPAGDLVKPALPSLDKGEPVLSYSVGQTPSYGGDGAGPFDFMPVGEALRNQVRIVSMRLADGDDVVHRLEVGYASDKAKWSKVHGAGGNAREILDLEDGNFPVRFKIRSGVYVDRMEVYLNDGRSTGAGGYKAGEQTWDVPEGGVVLGFAGRAGAVLDQVKIIHARLKPAEYR
jgi:hypothetical protein